VTVGQLVLAQVTHSITLLTLVHQNIYNSLTLLVSVLTRWKSDKGEESLKNTFGWRRLDVVGSISSLVFLFSLCFATAIEALQTVFHNGHLDTMHHPDWIMVTVCGNLGLWLLSFVTVGGYSYHQTTAVRQRHGHHLRRDRQASSRCGYTRRSSAADVWRDLCGCLFTLLTCSLVYFRVVTEDYSAYLDPVISLVYIAVLIWSCVPLVRDSCLILLQTIPGNVEISLLKKYLLKKFPGILALHEFHTWTFTPGTLVLTGHIVYQDQGVYCAINTQVEAFIRSQGFAKVTIQPEFPQSLNPSQEDIQNCNLKCKDDDCAPMHCCTEDALSLK